MPCTAQRAYCGHPKGVFPDKRFSKGIGQIRYAPADALFWRAYFRTDPEFGTLQRRKGVFPIARPKIRLLGSKGQNLGRSGAAKTHPVRSRGQIFRIHLPLNTFMHEKRKIFLMKTQKISKFSPQNGNF